MVEIERHIAADVDRVWELVSDLERWGPRLPTMRDVTRVEGSGPVGVGSRYRVRQPGLPPAVYEIDEWKPGSHFTWVASAPGVRTTASHRVVAEDGGTRLALSVVWSGPLAGVVRLLLESKAARMVATEAETFASLAEADDRPA
jgi:uncharacterized protein YndB with AHSA1/START domain